MSTKSRNFRIEDTIWSPFAAIAKKLGISATDLLKLLLRDFIKKPRIIIGEPEEIIDVPPNIQQKVEALSKIADKAMTIKMK